MLPFLSKLLFLLSYKFWQKMKSFGAIEKWNEPTGIVAAADLQMQNGFAIVPIKKKSRPVKW
jgi:hypothetical protein